MCVFCPRSDFDISGAACEGYVLRQAGRHAVVYKISNARPAIGSFQKTTLFCDHSGVLLSRAPLLQNKQVHVFSAMHLIPQVIGVFGSSRDVGHHRFNQTYRHGVLGIYREAGAWISVFPIRMIRVSPKAFSASREIRKFIHRDVLIWSWLRLLFSLSGTVLWVQWEPLSPRIPMWEGVKVAGWSAWCWQCHADLRNCKRQFHGFLWNCPSGQ